MSLPKRVQHIGYRSQGNEKEQSPTKIKLEEAHCEVYVWNQVATLSMLENRDFESPERGLKINGEMTLANDDMPNMHP